MAFSRCNSIKLHHADEIARFSFIVQKSISFLDLSLPRKSWCFHYDLATFCEWGGLGNFTDVSSEEKCQKLFAPRRRLLYTLHLDLPKGREHSLKEDAPKSDFFRTDLDNIPHLGLGRLAVFERFYVTRLSDFVPFAFEINVPKLKIFKWILKLSSSEDPFLGHMLLTLNVNRFLDCFYPVVTDSALFEVFIMHANIGNWITGDLEPEVLEYLLRHARQFRRMDLDERVVASLGRDLYFGYRFSNIGPVLKFISSPRFPSDIYRGYFGRIISSKGPVLAGRKLEDAEIFVKRERVNHVLQILWMYIVGRTSPRLSVKATSDALRLLWSSFSDPYISYEELKAVFLGEIRECALENIYEFYATAVGEFHEYAGTRSLQHLCRCTLRRTLQENGIWIPDGISRMGLPNHLRQFLNLEKECLPLIPSRNAVRTHGNKRLRIF